jgi:hypothetical protein
MFTGLLLISIVCICKTNYAQKYSIKDRWNIKANYKSYPTLGYSEIREAYTPTYNLEANYGILRFLETGIYTGFAQTKSRIINEILEDDWLDVTHKKAPVMFYGITTNIHLFPFFIKKENFWIDIYLSGKLGGFFIFSEESGIHTSPERKNTFEYGYFGGLSLYLGKHWGIYGEYGKSNFIKSRMGLSFKF